VLHVRPTERIQQVWRAATTSQAVDAALEG
jgi:hypothetical protein